MVPYNVLLLFYDSVQRSVRDALKNPPFGQPCPGHSYIMIVIP